MKDNSFKIRFKSLSDKKRVMKTIISLKKENQSITNWITTLIEKELSGTRPNTSKIDLIEENQNKILSLLEKNFDISTLNELETRFLYYSFFKINKLKVSETAKSFDPLEKHDIPNEIKKIIIK